MSIRIVDLNYAVPPRIETSAELASRIGWSEQKIVERTGIVQRHVAGDLDDPTLLAAEAARPLIERHGTPDLLLYAGTIPRQMLPEGSLFLHRELGLQGTPGFSVNAVCLSFLTALKVSDALISDGSCQRILICSAELASRGRNFDEPESAALLGDGAAAVLVEAAPDTSNCGLQCYRMQTWSEGVELAGVRGGGTHRPPDHPHITSADHLFHMDGEGLLRLTVPHLRRFLDTFLQDYHLAPEDFDLVIPHQPSGPGLRLLNRWGFQEDRIVNIIRDYGNCVSASMPMALAMANQQGQLQRGDKILLLGTAAGVSIGAGVLQW